MPQSVRVDWHRGQKDIRAIQPESLSDAKNSGNFDMTKDEFDKLSARLTEINNEIQRLMPSFMGAGGAMMDARIDSQAWAQKLQPLFDEHTEIVARLKAATVR
jgi:hypothetical protein